MPAKVDVEKCDGCGTCVESCPSQAIVIENEKANVKQEDCIDCNACEDACTTGAIKVEA
jgi:NAD-dependent dihydropyrimidine dehydrogenase PreA subunit